MLYTTSKVKNKILELDYISINTSVDKSIFNNDTIDISKELDNEYEKAILTKEDDEDYKRIDLEINGYKSYLVVVYDPSHVK